MKELKYSYENLQKFCNENGIELCRDYSTEKVRRETKIEGKCKTEGCNELFNKSFREIIENKGYFCKPCFNKISDNKNDLVNFGNSSDTINKITFVITMLN